MPAFILILVQTILLVPLVPFGVLQLGSRDKVCSLSTFLNTIYLMCYFDLYQFSTFLNPPIVVVLCMVVILLLCRNACRHRRPDYLIHFSNIADALFLQF